MNELKPCPFCGSEAKPVFRGSCNYITCSNAEECWCGMTCPASTKEEAITIWNRRAVDTHELDRPTCKDLASEDWYFFCSACESAYSGLKPHFCPSCGSEVVE